jgi:hypothetical protein
MPQASRLDLYLAAGIAQDESQHERLSALGVDLAAARAVREAAHRGTFGRDGKATPGALAALFGRPAVRRVERVACDLVLWPEHRYECAIQEWGVDRGELVRRENGGPVSVADAPSSVPEAREVLRPWYHTRRDAERILGDPVRRASASPRESYDWRLGDGSEVTCDFAHGLLLGVRPASSAAARSERRRWWALWRR